MPSRTFPLLLALSCGASVSGFIVGQTLKLVAATHPRAGSCSMQVDDLPVSMSSTLSELREFIAERDLLIKTTGKGRTKQVIYDELVSLLTTSEATSADAEQAAMDQAAAKDEGSEEDEDEAAAAAAVAEAAAAAEEAEMAAVKTEASAVEEAAAKPAEAERPAAEQVTKKSADVIREVLPDFRPDVDSFRYGRGQVGRYGR
jgi:hypothetical protein